MQRLLSVQQAARFLGLSARTIYNGIARKSKKPFPVKPKRFGKRALFDLRDLENFADNLPYDE
jgi:predicted DNA-binding transcriptional regulator AlpA